MDVEKLIKVKNNGKFLVATMPNGDVIPMQLDMIVKNGIEDRGMTEVIVTLRTFVPTSELNLMPDVKEKEG